MKRNIYFFLLVLFSTLAITVIFIKKDISYMPLFARHGDVIGKLDDVNVYFNDYKIKSKKVKLAPDGYRIGIEYQCVEFVKRYYYEYYNHKMPNVWGHARDYFNVNLSDGAYNKERNLYQYKNGSSKKPKKGDLLVYNNGKYGHVAIVSDVSDNSISIIHQNAGRFRPVRMKHSMKNENGKWVVENSSLLGWLRLMS